VEILAQSSADFALTYNFQDTHILGASRGHLCDSVVSCLDVYKNVGVEKKITQGEDGNATQIAIENDYDEFISYT